MRQIVLFVSVFVLFCTCIVNGAEPNFVRSTVKNVDGASHDVVSTDYTDGLGRALQSKLQLSNGRTIVVSSFYDNAGRPYLTTKPYIDLAANPVNLFTPGDFNTINTILDNPDNYYNFKDGNPSAYAYSESQYYDDPLGRVKRAGAPGSEYRLGSTHFTSSWTFGVTINTTELTYNFTTVLTSGGTPVNVSVKLFNGFISGTDDLSSGATVAQILDGFYNYLLTTPITNSNHFLSVAKDPDNKLTQELKDLFGRTVATRSENGTNPIIAKYDFDIFGNVLSEHAPKNGSATLISDSKYEYNTLGQLVRKETPDGAVERMTYDDAGNLTEKSFFVLNGSTEVFKEKLVYDYDDMGRNTWIGIPYMNGHLPVVDYFYDNTEDFSIFVKRYNIPFIDATILENTQGRLLAVASLNYPPGKRFFSGKPSCVVDLYSYTDEGLVKTKYKVIPGLPLQTIEYTYDNHGKLKTEKFKCGSTVSKKYYKYDADGNMYAIAHGDGAVDAVSSANNVVSYKNDFLGKFDTTLFSKISTGNMLRRTFNVRGWMDTSSFNGLNNFQQVLKYNDTVNPTFNGNIRASEITYTQGAITKKYKQKYTYDAVNRLTDVDTKDDPGNNPVPGFEIATYQYDNAGRFISKHEGTSYNNSYLYYNDPDRATSRLARAKSSGDGLYIYDYKGNLILDKSKNMYISYDWRNLPIKFAFYSPLPVGTTASSKISPDHYGTMVITDGAYHSTDPTNYVDYIDWLCENGAITLLSSVQMYYDAAGKRVLKVEK